MSIDYPCVHWDKGKCKKFSDDNVTSWCVEGPCGDEMPSNADKIRAMSDEELAEEISRSSILDLCDIVCGGGCKAVATFNKTPEQRCAEIVLNWLQQPAEEDNHE